MHTEKSLISFPLIVLDFDGVCTNFIDAIGSYVNHDKAHYGISPTSFANLQYLIQKTGAKVVVSSNWRKYTTDPHLITSYWFHPKYGKILNPINSLISRLGDAFIGMFPLIRNKTKAEVFKKWLVDNGIDVDNLKYVIFDDDVAEGFLESEFKDHFINIDFKTGLTSSDVNKAMSILKI